MGGKVNRIKNVAPFLSKLAAVWPRVVMAKLNLLLLHLESKLYVLHRPGGPCAGRAGDRSGDRG